MAVFWCDYHQRQEDVDTVGYVERADGTAICDDALDIEDEARQDLAELARPEPPDA